MAKKHHDVQGKFIWVKSNRKLGKKKGKWMLAYLTRGFKRPKKPADSKGCPGEVIIGYIHAKKSAKLRVPQLCGSQCEWVISNPNNWPQNPQSCDPGCSCSRPDGIPSDYGLGSGDVYYTDCIENGHHPRRPC
jgi:hypothetical protein